MTARNLHVISVPQIKSLTTKTVTQFFLLLRFIQALKFDISKNP